jgi:tetratricopeptide (TPR) repeat protein
MRVAGRVARTHVASGRFLWLVALALSGCRTVGGVAPVASGPPPVVVAPGELSAAARREADALLAQARSAFEGRRFLEVIRATDRILDAFAASEASGEALRLAAEASLEIGDADAADAAAARYLALLPPEDSRATGMRLLQARAVVGDPARALDRLLRIDPSASGAELEEGAAAVRTAADALDLGGLSQVVEGLGGAAGPFAPLADARLAVGLLEANRRAEAEEYARRAVQGGAAGDELAWAQGVLRGELPPGRGRVTEFTIGMVLPLGGPPAMADFATLVAEGVELAAATVLGDDVTVTVVARDAEGDPGLAASIVAELEAEGVAGIVGLLQDEVLVSGARARSGAVPIVSPTARSADLAGASTYSLEGPEPEAAEAIARYAASRAFQRIAMVYPETPEARVEADAFEAMAVSLGMPLVGRFAYEAGATFFEPQILAARDALRKDEIAALGLAEDDTLHMEVLQPAAIFLPIPPEDVEFVAPQLIHFGLDTLAIEILGTSGWTDPGTLEAVAERLTTGVVATAAVGGRPGEEGDARFRQAYEQFYRRSLVGPTPALGYDAALMLLEALRPGRVEPESVNAAFADLRGVQGATGVYSVVDGRIARAIEVVRIQDRVPVAEPAGFPANPNR